MFASIIDKRLEFFFFFRHEVRQIYPNKYINVDDRIYVFYTLFNLPGNQKMKRSNIEMKNVCFTLEIYLIACLIDFFSNAATYLKFVHSRKTSKKRKQNRFVLVIEPVSFLGIISFRFVQFLMMFEIQLIVFINAYV